MNNVIELSFFEPREADVRALQAVLPQCVQAAVAEVGSEGFRTFMMGYRNEVTVEKLAA